MCGGWVTLAENKQQDGDIFLSSTLLFSTLKTHELTSLVNLYLTYLLLLLIFFCSALSSSITSSLLLPVFPCTPL